jgi:serine/threonine-protein kinase HipA
VKTRSLNVWWDGNLVGEFGQNEHGDPAFVYAREWLEDANAPALSASLPKRTERFNRRECRPFFAGLLPEEGQRDAAARALGVSPANDFALLDRLGGDVAGALQLLPPGERPGSVNDSSPPTPLDDTGIVRVLDALQTRPLLAGETGLRLSLAGAQSKVPVVLVDGRVALPASGQPTTHILKPPIRNFAATTENEAFTMALASAAGLDVAVAEARVVLQRPFLPVQRYDRTRAQDGTPQRVHQEDFCQALGVPPEKKYASEGGPGFKACFELLRRVSARPAVEVLKLLEAVVFNAIVGNADAHGKNFSLLYDSAGPRLAPLYDLLATVVYPDLSQTFAMKIGKAASLNELRPKHWETFAGETGLGLPLIRRRGRELSEQVKVAARRVAERVIAPGLDANALEDVAHRIEQRAEQFARTLPP